MLLLELLRGQAGAEQVCPSLAARESLIPFLPPHPNYSNKMPVSMRNHDTHWHARTYTRNRNIHDLTYTLFYFFSPLYCFPKLFTVALCISPSRLFIHLRQGCIQSALNFFEPFSFSLSLLPLSTPAILRAFATLLSFDPLPLFFFLCSAPSHFVVAANQPLFVKHTCTYNPQQHIRSELREIRLLLASRDGRGRVRCNGEGLRESWRSGSIGQPADDHEIYQPQTRAAASWRRLVGALCFDVVDSDADPALPSADESKSLPASNQSDPEIKEPEQTGFAPRTDLKGDVILTTAKRADTTSIRQEDIWPCTPEPVELDFAGASALTTKTANSDFAGASTPTAETPSSESVPFPLNGSAAYSNVTALIQPAILKIISDEVAVHACQHESRLSPGDCSSTKNAQRDSEFPPHLASVHNQHLSVPSCDCECRTFSSSPAVGKCKLQQHSAIPASYLPGSDQPSTSIYTGRVTGQLIRSSDQGAGDFLPKIVPLTKQIEIQHDVAARRMDAKGQNLLDYEVPTPGNERQSIKVPQHIMRVAPDGD